MVNNNYMELDKITYIRRVVKTFTKKYNVMVQSYMDLAI
jgi:hypothetical protein